MPLEQILNIGGLVGAALLGGGGIATLIVAVSNRKIGLKTTETEANKVINVTWEAIVEDLQGQIVAGREEFTKQLTLLHEKVDKLQERLQDREAELYAKDRLLLVALGHIGRLELLIPPPVPERPEGL